MSCLNKYRSFMQYFFCLIFKNPWIKAWITHVLNPIALGGIIYIMFRSKNLLMFEWFQYFKIDIDLVRNYTLPYRENLPSWIYFSLPDGLWVYSFTSAMVIIWRTDYSNLKYWILLPFMGGIIAEILQHFKIIPGTFDILDLMFSIIAMLISILLITNKIKVHEKKKIYKTPNINSSGW